MSTPPPAAETKFCEPSGRAENTSQERNVVCAFYVLNVNVVEQEQAVQKTGHICIALERPPKDVESKSKTYKAAVSFASPNDALNKKLGRKIAMGRLQCGRPDRWFTFEMPESDKVKLSDVFDVALQKLLSENITLKWGVKQKETPILPKWVQMALRQKNIPSIRPHGGHILKQFGIKIGSTTTTNL